MQVGGDNNNNDLSQNILLKNNFESGFQQSTTNLEFQKQIQKPDLDIK